METNFVRTEFDTLIVLVKKKMRKASCHHEKLKMSGSGKKSGKEHFFYKTCNWQVSGSFTSCMVVQNKGKEMYNKVCCTCITLDSVKFFAFCGVRQQARAKFYFSFDLGYGPLKGSFKKVRVHLSK